MDLSQLPAEAIRVVAGPDLVYVYPRNHPALILTHTQVQHIWIEAMRGRAEDEGVHEAPTGQPPP